MSSKESFCSGKENLRTRQLLETEGRISTSHYCTLEVPQIAIKVDAILHCMPLLSAEALNQLTTASLLDIFRTGSLVLIDEVFRNITAKPDGDLGQLLTKAIDRLSIHVGLSNELRESDWEC